MKTYISNIPVSVCVCVMQVACIYICVLFVYTRSSSTANTYLTSSSKAERFGFVNESLTLLAHRGVLGFLCIKVDSPWVRRSCGSPTFLHLFNALHFLFLHLLHHQVLLSHHDGRDTDCHALDQGQDQASDQCILEGH